MELAIVLAVIAVLGAGSRILVHLLLQNIGAGDDITYLVSADDYPFL